MVTQEAKSMAELMSFVEYSPHFSYGSNNRRNKSIPGKNEDIFKCRSKKGRELLTSSKCLMFELTRTYLSIQFQLKKKITGN